MLPAMAVASCEDLLRTGFRVHMQYCLWARFMVQVLRLFADTAFRSKCKFVCGVGFGPKCKYLLWKQFRIQLQILDVNNSFGLHRGIVFLQTLVVCSIS